MPIYKCPKCGRTIEKPEGTYYCSVCGPSIIMVKSAPSKVGAKEIVGSEIHVKFYPETEVINVDTGEVIKIEEKQVIRVARDRMFEVLINPAGLITIYGFPAKITIEPYYR